jgi:hypothetical protein
MRFGLPKVQLGRLRGPVENGMAIMLVAWQLRRTRAIQG